jgi:hypothetical protein
MRDPARQERILAKLKLIWNRPECRDMRLGQLYLNLTRTPDGATLGDVWSVEDEEFEMCLDHFLETGEWPNYDPQKQLERIIRKQGGGPTVV